MTDPNAVNTDPRLIAMDGWIDAAVQAGNKTEAQILRQKRTELSVRIKAQAIREMSAPTSDAPKPQFFGYNAGAAR